MKMGSLNGAIAQLVERVLCKHEVVGSRPSGSTIFMDVLLKSLSDCEWNEQVSSLPGPFGVWICRSVDIVNEGFTRLRVGLMKTS